LVRLGHSAVRTLLPVHQPAIATVAFDEVPLAVALAAGNSQQVELADEITEGDSTGAGHCMLKDQVIVRDVPGWLTS